MDSAITNLEDMIDGTLQRSESLINPIIAQKDAENFFVRSLLNPDNLPVGVLV